MDMLTLYPYTWKDALVLHMYSHKLTSCRKDTCVCVSRYGNSHHMLTLYPYTWKDALVLHMYSHKLMCPCTLFLCFRTEADGCWDRIKPSPLTQTHVSFPHDVSLCEYIWRTNASFHVYGYSVSKWCGFPYLLTQTHVSFLLDSIRTSTTVWKQINNYIYVYPHEPTDLFHVCFDIYAHSVQSVFRWTLLEYPPPFPKKWIPTYMCTHTN